MSFLSNLINPAGTSAKYNAIAAGEIAKGKQEAYDFLDPFVQQGGKGFTTIADLYGLNGADAQKAAAGLFQTSPGYQFRFDQGVKAIDNSASAMGMRRSGATLKALTDYGQGFASNEYAKWLQGLGGLGGAGLTAAGKGSDVAMNAAGGIANLVSKTGENKANQGIAQGNLLGNLLGKAVNIFAGGM